MVCDLALIEFFFYLSGIFKMAKDKKTKAMEKAKKKEEKKNKQALKTEKKLAKQERRELEEDDEEDINLIMKKLAKTDTLPPPVNGQLIPCEPPSARVHFSLTPTPSGDLLLFGGQRFDGANQQMFSDTYRWNIDSNEWRRLNLEIPGTVSPPPRAAHQAVLHSNKIYVFGGEYSTVKQFYHHRDMWKYDLRTNVWSEIKAGGSPPSQRSGHRMIVWKGYIVVFGGFYDTFRDCKYFNDVHMFNISEERWESVEIGGSNLPGSFPSPRGGCCFFANPTDTGPVGTAFVYGGYVRNGKMSGEELTDMWLLNIRAPPMKSSWERISRKGTPPSKRSGLSCAVHKNRAILFGGVCDKEKPGLSLDSQFYNEMYAFDMIRRRWFILDYQIKKLVGVKKVKTKTIRSEEDKEMDSSEDESETDKIDEADGIVLKKFEWLFEYVDEHGKLQKMIINEEEDAIEDSLVTDHDTETVLNTLSEVSRNSDKAVEIPAPVVAPVISEEFPVFTPPATPPLETSVNELPSERISAALIVRNNQLVLYGGMAEVGDKEITYDDCWVLDLKLRDRWVKKKEGTMHQQKWLGEDSADESEFEDAASSLFDSSTSESDDDSDSEEDVPELIPEKKVKKTLKEKMSEIQLKHDLSDEKRTPALNESLKDFHARTKDHWNALALQTIASDDDHKDLKKRGFALAQERFDSLKIVLEKLRALEEEQKEREKPQRRSKK